MLSFSLSSILSILKVLSLLNSVDLVIDKPGEYLRFTMRMIFRLSITWRLSTRFPVAVGDTLAYPLILLAWSIMGLLRNFQRTWRESNLIGGWQSASLSWYITLTAIRYIRLSER